MSESQAKDILNTYMGKTGDHSVKIELFIKGEKGVIFQPAVTDEIVWETELRGSPSKLTFTVIKEDGVSAEVENLASNIALNMSDDPNAKLVKETQPPLSFPEGAPVILRVNDVNVFQGFVFEKKRNKKQQIECICYDQLRYFKNKHYMIYNGITATQVIKRLADDYKLQVGSLVDTRFPIPSRIEKDKSAFDIALKALDITTGSTKEAFVLYDDFGKLTLKNQKDWYVPVVINEYTAQDFDYTSSIDKDTYNVVRIYPEKGETTKTLQEPKSAKNDTYTNAWGILRYNETVPNDINLQQRADKMLEMKCRPTRDLTIQNAFGDLRVRAGCHLPIMLALGDRTTNYCLRCDKVTHRITSNYHVMDLTLSGHYGEFGED